MPIESTLLMPPWTLTANLMFMENFNGPGRGAVLGFSGLAIINSVKNDASHNMQYLSSFRV